MWSQNFRFNTYSQYHCWRSEDCQNAHTHHAPITIGVWARGLVGPPCSPPRLGQNRHFYAKTKFFGQKLAAKNEIIRISFCLTRMNKIAGNRRLLLIITGWGESGKVILQVSIAFFSGAVEKIFGQRWLSPQEKIGPYACADNKYWNRTTQNKRQIIKTSVCNARHSKRPYYILTLLSLQWPAHNAHSSDSTHMLICVCCIHYSELS